ncbi:MAG: T9SS C-terminal target domain-containing protein [Calditrichaeota bacterium]|nr:MAG: T9SS C-terminal target domain-containing protein [Calditrichota bacterium]
MIDTTQHIIPPDSAFAGFFLLVNVADTAVSDEDNLLQNFTLSQNYPNPFGKLTQWQINVPQPGRLSIRIFDTRGRLTRSILSEEVDSGLLNIDWDGTNNSGQHVANGVYIIEAKYNTATGENKSLTKRLVYLK